jgi:hypothetical protein
MRGRKSAVIAPRLARAAKRLDDWRRSTPGRRRIPAAIWTMAADLAGTYGVARTAAALKLTYYDLQKRLQARTSLTGKSAQPTPAPTFVELPAAALAGPTECLIELENAAGAKMRLHLTGAPTADLVTLSGRLWEAQQ